MNHDSHANAEIVLRAVEQSRRIVVELNCTNINPVACTNVDTATECTGKSSLGLSEISWTRAWDDCDAKVVAEVYAIASVCSARRERERMA